MNTGPASVRLSVCVVFAGLLLSGCASYGVTSSNANVSGQSKASQEKASEVKGQKAAGSKKATEKKVVATKTRPPRTLMERLGFGYQRQAVAANARTGEEKKADKAEKSAKSKARKNSKDRKVSKNTGAGSKAARSNVRRRQPRTLAEYFGFRRRQAVAAKTAGASDAASKSKVDKVTSKKVKSAEKNVRDSLKNAKASTASKEVQNSVVRRQPRNLAEFLGFRSRSAAVSKANRKEAEKSDSGKARNIDKTTTSTVTREKDVRKAVDTAKKTVDKKENVQLARLPSTVRTSGQVTRSGEVYLFRGLANVFSRGMDQMAVKMARRGLDARVYNHAAWGRIAENIIARSKAGQVSYPIVIMGHSLGANASTQMAKYLGDRGIPVSYVVSFDPTITTYVGKNVKQVTNYYLPNDRRDNIVVKSKGFGGKLRNVDMSFKGVNHFIIEKNRKLQVDSIDRVMAITKQLPKSKRG